MEGENKRTDSSREYKEKGRTRGQTAAGNIKRRGEQAGNIKRRGEQAGNIKRREEEEDTAAAGYIKKKG